jgi:Leucine-rich repeat (LRR) protein
MRTGMSKSRAWIYLSVVMALLWTMGLLAVAGTPGPVQADGNPVVIFPDPNLEAVIRKAIDKPIGDIYQSELEDLTEFSAEQGGIVNITGLEHCTNLRSLDLSLNHIISDISPLAGLTSLIELNLWHNQISDISPLASLTSLIELNLGSNEIGDISLLASLTNLTLLDLGYNQIGDISPLANLTSLTSLSLSDNQISDISPLANLTGLTELELGANQISDISLLANLTSLIELELEATEISDISPLASLTDLTSLNLWGSQVSDISPLAGLASLTQLDLGANQISDIFPLANLTSLTSLDLGQNQISDISPLAKLTSLITLDLWGNQISDISPLANLTSLTELDLGSNNITHIKPLVDNPGLGDGDHVALQFNPLSAASLSTYIPQLEARGVIVNYRDLPGWCFIATAAYGTPLAQQIQILREFRDEYLLTNPVGQALVDLYYRVSPPIAEFITEHPSLKSMVRVGLAPAVAMSAVVVDTSLAEKIAVIPLLLLASVTFVVWATRRRGKSSEYTRG